MRDFRDAKAMAHALRGALQVKAVDVTHSESLELIAKTFGFDNWNVLAAKIEAAMPPAPKESALADAAAKQTLYCSFCGKSQHEVTALIAGPAVFICDECTGLCNEVLEDKEILGLLKADEERGDRAFSAAFAEVRAKSVEDLASLVERSRRGIERHRLELYHTRQALAARDVGGLAAADDPAPSRLAHLKKMPPEGLRAREQHVARNLKSYEDMLRIATSVLGER
jgi:hypothetical protein